MNSINEDNNPNTSDHDEQVTLGNRAQLVLGDPPSLLYENRIQSINCNQSQKTETNFSSHQTNTEDGTSVVKPPYPVENNQWYSTKVVSKKRKMNFSSSSPSPRMIRIQKRASKINEQKRILKSYWNEKSKQVIKEQFERDERIKKQKDREELARSERVRKQQFYNGDSLDTHRKQQPIEFELVLETDPQTNDIIIDVSLFLVIDMKPHQIDAVKFLWNQVFESTVRIEGTFDEEMGIDRGGSGAILAHCMGLGKTFTIIVLLHTLFRYTQWTHIRRVLILCPLNTTINWRNEFHAWLGDLEPRLNVYLFNNDDIRTESRNAFLDRWYKGGGILLMGYEMYRQLTYTNDDKPFDLNKGLSTKNQRTWSLDELTNIEQYRKYLRDPGPDLIICDEGHVISKNLRSAIACTLNKIRTHHRIVLTGTPMQNNLKEYFAMVNFCKPNFLGTEREFSDHFRLPIEAGQHRDSSPGAVAYMRRRIYVLHRRLQPVIHRRGFDVLRAFLPPKFEYAIKIKCRPVQRTLYETYIRYYSIGVINAHLNMTGLFGDYQYLMKIWTHPWLLQPYSIEYNKKHSRDDDDDLFEIDNIFEDDFSDRKQSTEEISPTCNILLTATKNKLNSPSEMQQEWWFNLFDPKHSQFDLELSGKFVVLKAILNECDAIGDKLLVFSRSLIALNYIEQCLGYWSDEQSASSRWKKGIDYFRVDGQVSIKQRAADMKLFNNVNNIRSRLFLISTLADGMGINLFSANRVIILDTSWNPAHDLQAMFRSYRLGQTKPVYIYRLMVKGTMEEKIYKRQITKQAMFHRVVDAEQLPRHFTHEELAQLYQFDFDVDNDPTDHCDSSRVQDQILRHIVNKYRNTIISCCGHDSFLIHREEENLTVEEQKQARYEDENPSARLRREHIHSKLSSDV